jgi:hypothetical protein
MLSIPSLLLATFLIAAGFLFLWPLVSRWLGHDNLLTLLTAFGLSIGLLSLWSFALAWLGVLSIWPVLGLVAIFWALGFAFNRSWFRFAWLHPALKTAWGTLVPLDLAGLALLVIILSLSVILVNNLYYPFLSDDTLTRYALEARLVYEGGSLPDDLQGFPLLVPLSFAYTWLVGGAVNDHLARLVSFAFGAGMLGTTVLLGRRLGGRLCGLLAGAILATTPIFVGWSATGYTDIPTGFYVALAGLFALRWSQDGALRDALLAGVMVGLALWAKQSAFIILASLVGVAGLRAIVSRDLRAGLSGLSLFLLPSLVIAGPWYLRNYFQSGTAGVLVLPGEFHLLGVKPRLGGLTPALQYPFDFGLGLVPLYASGLAFSLWRSIKGGWAALRGRGEWPLPDLVGWIVWSPYWLAWWIRFSFTSRFLMVVIPFYAIWAAWPLSWLAGRGSWAKKRNWLAVPLAALLLLMGTRTQLGAIGYVVLRPFASDAAKLTRAKDDLYPTVLWLEQNLEPDAHVLSMDARLRYYLPQYDIVSGFPLSFEQISTYDYVVDYSGTTSLYQTLGWTGTDYWLHRRDPHYFEEVFDGGEGSEIFRVLPSVGAES